MRGLHYWGFLMRLFSVRWLRRALVVSGLACWLFPSAFVRAAPASDIEPRVAPCVACHGADGRATAQGYYPRIAGKPVAYLYSQLLGFRDGRRNHPAMAPVVVGLTDAYLAEMADYFARQNPPYALPPVASDPAEALKLGEQIARNGTADGRVPACAACHGDTLEGLDPVMPGLTGLSRDYLNAQLGAWINGSRKAAAPDCMAEIVRRMKPEEISAVTAWLSTRRPVGGARMTMAGRVFPLQCGTHRPGQAFQTAAVHDNRQFIAARSSDAVKRGAYLATVGNCSGCHSLAGQAPYAGGVSIQTPYGVVYSSNLTPDPQTGLGRWSADSFYRALTQGISRDGHRLYPAFPWPYFSRFSRAESDDLFAFLQSVPAVYRPTEPARMQFPYNWRPLLVIWDRMRQLRGAASANAVLSTDPLRMRGEWLVNGPGHCGACHTPKGLLGTDLPAGHLMGAEMPVDGWYAPGLWPADKPMPVAGQADPMRAEGSARQQYLQSGSDGVRMAAGPMAHVVFSSLQYWSESDIASVDAYLNGLATARRSDSAVTRRQPIALSSAEVDRSVVRGRSVYERHCQDCHGAAGLGKSGKAPALVWQTADGVRHVSALPNAARLVFNGGYAPATSGNPRPFGMPAYRTELSSQAIADVLTWMRVEWKTSAPPVSAADVERYRGVWNAQH